MTCFAYNGFELQMFLWEKSLIETVSNDSGY